MRVKRKSACYKLNKLTNEKAAKNSQKILNKSYKTYTLQLKNIK